MKYRDFLNTMLEDPEFKKEWDESEGEYQAMRALAGARYEAGITQKELSELSHVPQKTISQIETGNVSARVSTLAKIAKALGKSLKIEFV